MGKCREEFELWFYKESPLHYEYDKSQVFVKFKEPDDTEDDYYLLAVREAWKAWQASRESMKAIKLPKSKEIYHMNQHFTTDMIDLNDTINAITSAGYKVEE